VYFIDCGNPRDPSNELLWALCKKKGIDRTSPVFLLITHSHLDHTANIPSFRRHFSQFRCIVPANDAEYVQYPRRTSPYGDRIKELANTPKAMIFSSKIMLQVVSPLVFSQRAFVNPVHFTIPEDVSRISLAGRIFTPISTPGHSPGHIAYLDETKYLFLGDCVPGTPWLDPAPGSLEQMMNSIQKLLHLPAKKVEYSVRSHCNVRDNAKIIYPWEDERARFETFYDRIVQTLDRIPLLLRGITMTTLELGYRLFNLSSYLTFFTRLWAPAGLSWVIGYLDYLERRGEVQQVSLGSGKRIAWTS